MLNKTDVNNGFSVGKWQNTAVLVIHAAQAEALIKGQRVTLASNTTTHRIFGLKTYSVLVENVYQRAKADDPYAEKTLIEVERRIDNAVTVIHKAQTQLDQHLEQHLPGIRVNLWKSQKPLLVPLSFLTPHANLGARLVGEYDLLARKVETCRRLGLLNSQQRKRSRYLRHSRRVIRGVFLTPVQYKNMTVTRHDIIHQTPRGINAIKALGIISDAILQRQERAVYGPY